MKSCGVRLHPRITIPTWTLSFLTLLTSGMFVGAALYVTAVEHPARMSQGASFALQEFRASYKRAAAI
jgi:hypothetical protein